MIEAIGDKIFSEYGVLGIGWVVSIVLYLRLMKVSDALHEVVKANTAAWVEFSTLLKERLPKG